MTLLRAAYRTMLASYFITSGVKALRDPDSLVPVAEPLADATTAARGAAGARPRLPRGDSHPRVAIAALARPECELL